MQGDGVKRSLAEQLKVRKAAVRRGEAGVQKARSSQLLLKAGFISSFLTTDFPRPPCPSPRMAEWIVSAKKHYIINLSK